MDLNLKAPFFLTQAFLPLLEAGRTHEDPARVINIGRPLVAGEGQSGVCPVGDVFVTAFEQL